MQKWLRQFLLKPVLWLSNRLASHPNRKRVFKELSDLLLCINDGDTKKGLVIPFDMATGRFIIFSDQHKGCRDGADDFMLCEPNYLAALDYYNAKDFCYIAMGDCEELWENTWTDVKKQQRPSFAKEKKFIDRNAFIKIFGNHDLYWANDPFAFIQLKDVFGTAVPIYEGVVLQANSNGQPLQLFCAHGHQGDTMSDGNWFSKFFVSNIWAPLQAFTRINPNTPAYDAQLKTLHNSIMYDWSAQQKNLLLITGHTHQPVFESLTHMEQLYRQLLFARQQKDENKIGTLQKEVQLRKFEYTTISEDYLTLKPCYFNSGCCCYNDGDITGIEIDDGCIRLVKWHSKEGTPQRIVLEERELKELLPQLK
jgi:UDP-2,3-diacylglucosamine pyrophosphatase LpxH